LPCGNLPPCDLGEADLKIYCTGDGGGGYMYDLNFIYGTTGTVIVNSHQGTATPNTYLVNPGANNLYGGFIDTPAPDGVMCLDVYIYDGNNWCHSQICAAIPLEDPCFKHLPPCEMEVQNETAVC